MGRVECYGEGGMFWGGWDVFGRVGCFGEGGMFWGGWNVMGRVECFGEGGMFWGGWDVFGEGGMSGVILSEELAVFPSRLHKTSVVMCERCNRLTKNG